MPVHWTKQGLKNYHTIPRHLCHDTGDWLAALLIGATLLKDGLSCRIQPVKRPMVSRSGEKKNGVSCQVSCEVNSIHFFFHLQMSQRQYVWMKLYQLGPRGLPWISPPFLLLGKLSGALVVIAVLRTAALLFGATQNGAWLGVPLAGVANALTDLWQTALVWPKSKNCTSDGLVPGGFLHHVEAVPISFNVLWQQICYMPKTSTSGLLPKASL